MNENQAKVLANRIVSFPGETWEQVVDRVVKHVISCEDYHEAVEMERDFKEIMLNMWFLPNSPCLRNFGANNGNGSACFVLPIEDSRQSIFKTLSDAVEVQALGGGTGFNFSEIRPKGSLISSTNGQASGPLSFIGVFDYTVGNVIAQGGVRKGANMAVLDCTHPDIFEFVKAKSIEGKYSNFNFSVGITDDFMNAVRYNENWILHHPKGNTQNTIKARELWNLIIECAHRNGEPGVVFLDTINKDNPYETIKATNPCGEQPLPPHTSCVLGSLNLRAIPPEKLMFTVRTAVRFLDNVIETNNYPVKEIEERTKHYRNIGLGVMGYHDWLIKRNTVYGSDKALEDTRELMRNIQKEAENASMDLAVLKGKAPCGSERRNANLTTVAPTGSLSMLADCSAGIEPYFAFEFEKQCMDQSITVKSSIMEEAYDDCTLVTAQDVSPADHLRTQACFQEFIDAGISKTINLPNDTSQFAIDKIYRSAWIQGCKGVTVYRDGSRQHQAQSVATCPTCKSPLVKIEGCVSCSNPECGYSACSI